MVFRAPASVERGQLAGLALLTLGAACGPGDGVGEPIGASAQKAVVCADGPTLEGIDVSHYQGSVDWHAVAGSGRAFGIARVKGATAIDTEFEANWAGMKAAGMIRGAYIYFRPGEDAGSQADLMIAKVGKLGPGDLPAVIDVEQTDGESAASVVAKVEAWSAKVEAGTGKRPIVYTGSNFWQTSVKSDAFSDHPLWIAHYTQPCPNLPDAWSDWAFWQYSDKGSVPGVSGPVDVNQWKGTRVELDAFAGILYGARLAEPLPALRLAPGESATLTLVFENVGTRPWDGGTKLGTTEPRDRASAFAAPGWLAPNRLAAFAGEVLPGEEAELSVSLVAPAEPGTYVEHLGLVQEGVAWFGDRFQGGPPDPGLALSIEVASEAPGGEGGGGEGGGSGAKAGGGASPEEAPAGPDPNAPLEGACAFGPGPPESGEGLLLALSGLAGLAELARRRAGAHGRRGSFG